MHASPRGSPSFVKVPWSRTRHRCRLRCSRSTPRRSCPRRSCHSEESNRSVCPRLFESKSCTTTNCSYLHPDFLNEHWVVPDIICHKWFQGQALRVQNQLRGDEPPTTTAPRAAESSASEPRTGPSLDSEVHGPLPTHTNSEVALRDQLHATTTTRPGMCLRRPQNSGKSSRLGPTSHTGAGAPLRECRLLGRTAPRHHDDPACSRRRSRLSFGILERFHTFFHVHSETESEASAPSFGASARPAFCPGDGAGRASSSTLPPPIHRSWLHAIRLRPSYNWLGRP